MAKYKEYELRFNVPAMIKICRKLNITLHALLDWQMLSVADMLEAIPILLEAQLKEKGISAEQFLETLSPTELPELFTALGEAVREAFPQMTIAVDDEAGGKKADPLAVGN